MKYSSLFLSIPFPFLGVVDAYFIVNDMYLSHTIVLVIWSFFCLAMGVDLAKNRSI